MIGNIFYLNLINKQLEDKKTITFFDRRKRALLKKKKDFAYIVLFHDEEFGDDETWLCFCDKVVKNNHKLNGPALIGAEDCAEYWIEGHPYMTDHEIKKELKSLIKIEQHRIKGKKK